MPSIIYNATETASEFHNDNFKVRLLFGPVGCGKSVAGCIEVVSRAMQQEPDAEGVRRTRWAIVRNTYPDLKSTTIPTWLTWVPEEVYGKIKWDSPINHHLKFEMDDGTTVDAEVLFISLDSPADIKKLNSLEVTGIYINELQFIHFKIFETAMDRINRFPPKIYGVPITWNGLWADTNPPDQNHWIYKRIDVARPKGWKMYRYQPTVLKVKDPPANERYETSLEGTHYINNPAADYRFVQNDPDYCIALVPGKTDEKIKVSYRGEYGMILDGKPVHPTYNDHFHFANRIIPYDPTIELGLGFDWGLTPACAIGQLTPRGQFLVIDELWSEDMGARDFIRNIVLPHLDTNYPGWRIKYKAVGDPSGSKRSDADAQTCFEVAREEGLIVVAASSNNNAAARRDGLKYHLGRMVDGMPALSLSLKCEMIRTGLMGGFQYARLKVGGDERYHEEPLKNLYSHVCEGLEYLAMNYSAENKKPPKSGKKPSVIMRGDPLG